MHSSVLSFYLAWIKVIHKCLRLFSASLNETVCWIKAACKLRQVGSIEHLITELYKLESFDKPTLFNRNKNVENLFGILLADLGSSKPQVSGNSLVFRSNFSIQDFYSNVSTKLNNELKDANKLSAEMKRTVARMYAAFNASTWTDECI
jgi:hypothetical protein